MSDGNERRCGFRQTEAGPRADALYEHEGNPASARSILGWSRFTSMLKHLFLIVVLLLQQQQSNAKSFAIEPRAAAAVGQSGLMSLYDAMFSQYGVKIAQVWIYNYMIVNLV